MSVPFISRRDIDFLLHERLRGRAHVAVGVLVAATLIRRRSLVLLLADSIKPTSNDPLAC